MRRGVALSAGVALCVAAGLLVAAARIPASAGDEPVVSVPVGRVGDEVGYEIFKRASAGGPWERESSRTFRLAGIEAAYDASGTPRAAVVLQWDRGGGMYAPQTVALDLRDRSVVRNDFSVSYGGSQAETFTDFGPTLEPAWLGHHNATVAWYQGRTLRLGDDLSHAARGPTATLLGLDAQGVVLSAFSSAVVGPGTVEGGPPLVDGARVLGVKTTGVAQFAVSPGRDWEWWTWGAENGRLPFFSFQVPHRSTVAFDMTAWLSGSSPYPLLVEERVAVEGGPSWEAVHVLARHTPGGAPVPWGEALPVEAAPLPAIERTPPGQRFPADGQDPAVGFPLASALAAIRSDPLATTVREWLASHPDAVLAGAEFRDCTAAYCHAGFPVPRLGFPVARWGIIFATPEGDGFYLRVFPRDGPLPPVVQDQGHEVGPLSVPPFRVDDLPQGGPTFAAAEALVAALATPDVADGPVMDVWWGYAYYPTGWRYDPSDMQSMGACRYDFTPTSDPDAVRFACLQIHATTGDLVMFEDGTGAWPPGSSGAVPDPAPLYDVGLPVLAAAPAKEAAPPSVRVIEGAAVGTTLLALFLAMYFFPALKFAIGGGAGWVLAHTRLAPDDVVTQPLRRRLVQMVMDDPGITPPELQRGVGAGWSTVVYHLRVLERHGVVVSTMDGRHRRYFARDVDRRLWPRIGALRHGRTRAVHEALQAGPGRSRRELARLFGVSVPTMLWHLDRLQAAGLVQATRSGGRVIYGAWPGPDASEAAGDSR